MKAEEKILLTKMKYFLTIIQKWSGLLQELMGSPSPKLFNEKVIWTSDMANVERDYCYSSLTG